MLNFNAKGKLKRRKLLELIDQRKRWWKKTFALQSNKEGEEGNLVDCVLAS